MKNSIARLLLGGVILLAAAVWLNSAWVGDDAYITFRTVQNTWLGFGPRWNVIERVQSYSHPLWFILLSASYPFTNNLYISALALSFISSAFLVWPILRFAASKAGAGLAIALLCSSTAFVEFTSSGLENPLTYLLVVMFWIQFWLGADRPSWLLRLAIIFSICALNRTDTVLLIGPALAVAVWQRGVRRSFSHLTLGLTPLIAWTCFALFYYGFLLPNTAYAKLGGGIPEREVAVQGLRYAAESATRDYSTLPTVALAGLLAIAWRRGQSSCVGLFCSLS
jgi:arabinofuranosyltransferase